MNILQYNVLYGCRTKERYTQLSNWLTNHDYDVVGFNELNDWTEVEFQAEMEKLGYPYSCLFEMESSPFYIGITAKFPIEKINSIEMDPFHHGMLHVKINDINFIVTHLSPFDSEHRERETEQIAAYIKPIQEALVVMGDFNTLSPLDREYYGQPGIIEKITAKKNHILGGAINYRPMEILLEAGLHDVGFSKSLDHSMPTQMDGDVSDAVSIRIDYILVNSVLLKSNPVAKMVHHPEVAMTSDHYPIQCQWDTNPTSSK